MHVHNAIDRLYPPILADSFCCPFQSILAKNMKIAPALRALSQNLRPHEIHWLKTSFSHGVFINVPIWVRKCEIRIAN
jgi:hypothetical protein